MSSAASFIPWDARWHLQAEMARLTNQLGKLVGRQRERGRRADADPVGSLIIEPGEAEGLVADLAARWSEKRNSVPSHSAGEHGERQEIAERARSAAAQGCFLPLARAASAFELEAAEYDALLLALAVELD